MSTATPTIDPAESDAAAAGLLEACRSACVEQTLAAFKEAGLASGVELEKVKLRYRDKLDNDEPADLIEVLARIQGTDEEHMGIEVSRISHGVATALNPSPPLIPFAGKLIAPSAFYEAYTQLHELAAALRSRVLFAEDSDAIGTGALNPVAARIMAAAIREGVNRRYAIRPFVTAVRLDYESWNFLNRKHFAA